MGEDVGRASLVPTRSCHAFAAAAAALERSLALDRVCSVPALLCLRAMSRRLRCITARRMPRCQGPRGGRAFDKTRKFP